MDSFIKYAIIPLLGLGLSCNPNRMKVNERTLIQEIYRQEEQQLLEAKVQQEQRAEALKNRPQGLKLPEERNVDPAYRPLTIDIAGSLNNIRDFTLSDVAYDIKYIMMQRIADPDIPHNVKYRYKLLDNYIAAYNLYGIHLYSKDGRYLRSVVKNKLTGVYVDITRGVIISSSESSVIGGRESVWSRGDQLYYTYINTFTGQACLMEVNCSSDELSVNPMTQVENPGSIIGLGKVKVDLNHGSMPLPEAGNEQNMRQNLRETHLISELWTFDDNTYTRRLRGKNMMGVFDSQTGDTVTTFTKFEQLVNYTKSIQRGTDGGFQYERNGSLFFRSDFNDTVFQFISPNRIIPRYVLNLGPYKVSKQNGVDPGFDLEGKIIPEEWAETKDFIFLTFTKDDYDCPANRSAKKVKIYHALYIKADRKLWIIDSDPYDYDQPILENDIDGGLPVWPCSFHVGSNMVTDDGDIVVSVSGKELKAHITKNLFKNSGAPEGRKNILKQLAVSVADDDDILMLVKMK